MKLNVLPSKSPQSVRKAPVPAITKLQNILLNCIRFS